MMRSRWALIAGAAILVRVVIACLTVGTNDMLAWLAFARGVEERALCDVYAHVTGMGGQFNHPPLMGWMAVIALKLARATASGFHVWFKLVMVASDAAVVLLLHRALVRRIGAARAGVASCLFAWNPLTILVSAYHGNTDALCVALAFAALVCLDEERDLLAGLFLGLALNVKLIPVLLGATFLVETRHRLRWLRIGAGAVPGLLLLVMPSVALGCFEVFRTKCLHYAPHLEHWGVPYILLQAHLDRALAAYRQWGRFWMFAAIALAALLARSRRADGAALTFALFLILTPGFGVQYLSYVVPFLFLAAPRHGALFSLVAGIFVGGIYAHFIRGPIPYTSILWGRFPEPWPRVGLIAWALLVVFVGRMVWQHRGALRPTKGPEPAPAPGELISPPGTS